MPIDPASLLLLSRIRETGSLAKASRTLGLTPAAVTGRLARLEREWGVTLVVRGPRGARLTTPGGLLADSGDVVATECTRAQSTMETLFATMTRRLRVGAFQAAGQHLLPPALTALRHRHQVAELTVHEISSRRGPGMVADGEADIAIVAAYDLADVALPGVQPHPLLADPMIICLPEEHPLVRDGTAADGLSLHDLRDEPWIVITAGHAARSQFDRAATAAGFTPRVTFETASYHVAQALVGTGIGVSVLSTLTAYPTAGAVHVPLKEDLQRDIYALTPQENVSALAHNLLVLLRDECARLEEARRSP